ncbi:helix-turn-helix domain-containing protein [Spirosoma sp. KNUC1025]|uniref:helix-turn-helix domain-containing protein n=1 Tax=Spirosoma sp. KNUC1025 TaxID=2894082 RepID=UPI003867A730|nr:helix-turn-helix domain-containing protein [Spirosoma sp. KNUC1025]
MSEAEKFSQQLQEQGQQLTPTQRLTLVACFKATLTLEEASAYSGISKSYLYKLTSGGVIPHYKPDNKKIFFDRAELDSWLKRNRVKTVQEIEQEATTFVLAKGQKGGVSK